MQTRHSTSIITAVILALGLTITTAPAFASVPVCENGFCAVESNGSVMPKDTFSFGEQPFLKLELPASAADFSVVMYRSPNSDFGLADLSSSVGGDKWYTLNAVNWSNPNVIGEWSASASYFDGAWISKDTTFTVTPEPLAMILFAVGGLPIAANLYRRRKTSAAV